MGCGCGFCCVADCGFCCIGDFCSDSGCSYHPDRNDTADHAKKIADETAAMKTLARAKGREIGRELLGSRPSKGQDNEISQTAFGGLNSYMSQLMEFLSQYNQKEYGGKKLDLHLEKVQAEIKDLQESVLDYIGDRLDERLVETDPELSVILQERDDETRKRRFDEFYSRIHREAVIELTHKVEDVIGQQFNIVREEIGDRLGEVQSSMKKALRDYREAEKAMAEQERLPQEQIKEAKYEIDITKLLQKELQEDVAPSAK